VQSEPPVNTRKKLIAAGIQIFAKKGYRDATIREICNAAGSANINAVNYYFGSKEKLYKEILETIFSEYDKYDDQAWKQKTPHQQLKAMITNFCTMLYKNNAFAADLTAIFISEMTRPSPFLTDLVDTYNRPRIKKHLKMVCDLLGEGATEDMARDCLVSVAGQLFYYSFAWSVFSRLFPDYSADKQYEQWAEHVYRFSLGGIEAVKKQWKKGEDDHGN
jgi:TetR/AcrR family transcriptional regulator, regulator of cefoperazone and chloramphenicol sensitivity